MSKGLRAMCPVCGWMSTVRGDKFIRHGHWNKVPSAPDGWCPGGGQRHKTGVVAKMVERALEDIDYLRGSMKPDEWLTFLKELRAAIDKRIAEAPTGDKSE
jgi:hypothetical protein